MEIREIILDTETTGLNPKDGHKIVEIGCIEMIDKVITGKHYHTYINPERDVPEAAYAVHNLHYDFLKKHPKFSDIAADFIKFIDKSTLVIHNAAFDIGFLNHELNLVKYNLLDITQVIDTLKIARNKFKGAKVNLDALCRRFKIDNRDREYHGALLDAKLLAKVYIELCGGVQRTFAFDKIKTVSSEQDFNISPNAVQGNGIIIKPTDEEMEAHFAMLKIIQ